VGRGWEVDGKWVGTHPGMVVHVNRFHNGETMNSAASPIDMYTPDQACEALGLDHDAVVDLVNTSRLSAYRLGGHIRFKVVDVRALKQLLTFA